MLHFRIYLQSIPKINSHAWQQHDNRLNFIDITSFSTASVMLMSINHEIVNILHVRTKNLYLSLFCSNTEKIHLNWLVFLFHTYSQNKLSASPAEWIVNCLRGFQQLHRQSSNEVFLMRLCKIIFSLVCLSQGQSILWQCTLCN